MTATGASSQDAWRVPPALVTAAVCAGVLDACIVLLRGYEFQGGSVKTPVVFIAWMSAQREVLPSPEVDPFFRSTYAGSFMDPFVGFYCFLIVLKQEVEFLRNGLQELEASPRVELAAAIAKSLEDAACFARGTTRDLAVASETDAEGTIH